MALPLINHSYMEYLKYLCITIVVSTFLLFNLSGKEVTLEDQFTFEKEITVDKEFQKELERARQIRFQRDVKDFFSTIGWLESRNRYYIRNGSYLGKYQLGRSAMKDINLSVSRSEFLVSPEIQESAMVDFLYRNKSYLQRYIDEYAGKKFDGIYITEAGILAGAHLGGASSIKRYFDSGGEYVFTDANGTPVRRYISYFQSNRLFTLEGKSKDEIKDIIHNEFTTENRIEKNGKSHQAR